MYVNFTNRIKKFLIIINLKNKDKKIMSAKNNLLKFFTAFLLTSNYQSVEA